MACNICFRNFTRRRQPYCPSCARATLYEARIDQVTALLAKESSRKDVETVLKPRSERSAAISSGPEYKETDDSAKKIELEQQQAEKERIDDRLNSISEQLEILKKNIEDGSAEVASRKAQSKQQKADLQSEIERLDARKPQLLEPIQASIQKLDHRLKKVQTRTVESRVTLCREIARLAGLQQRRRRTREGRLKEDYAIGGIGIVDLRDLNTARPDQVTASLANLCRLITTCCHYLSVRLPAEITMPHADYPHPTIFSVQSSYQGIELPFPGSTPNQSTINSPTASRFVGHRSLPKLRLLHLDRPLPRLAKEDVTTYNLFIEGVTLLAWDIAWLCRSQGVLTIDTWEDVCQIGKNLWALFVESASSPSTPRHSQHGTPTPATESSKAAPQGLGSAAAYAEPTAPVFGAFSHAASYMNLAGPAGTELMRSWRLVSPARIVDNVKSHLLTEMSGAEWEVLDEKEWNEDREDEQAVLVGGPRKEEEIDGVVSVVTAGADGGGGERKEERRAKGSSGWMKLKSRSEGA